MALPWWLATKACTAPPPGPGSFADLLAFLFLSPCPQRLLLAACLVHLARRRLRRGQGHPAAPAAAPAPTPEREALLQKPSHHPSPPLSRRHVLALGASAVFAAASAVLLALAHGVAAWTVVASSRRAGAAPPEAHLRVFWLATALGAALFSASQVVRGAVGSLLFPDDILAFAGLLVSLPLAYIAVTGFTGHGTQAQEEGEPEHAGPEDPPSSPYAAASCLSRATFSWINSLINKGYAAESLKAEDVPPVSAGHRAEAAHALFMSNWPASPASRHPVGVALWLSFWPHLVLAAFLGLARLGAMYVGPSLIDRFVEFIRRGGTPWEGLWLVLILLAGKAVQTLASHHYSFQGQLLGMRIRGALQTALYRKSLRLTAGARRAHGAGSIVNYTQVDPGIVSYAMHGPRRGRTPSAARFREIRREELGCLAKIMLFMCANTVVFSSGPLAMTELVFGTYLASGGQLDAGKEFTATAFFGMLEGPIQNFPQTIVMSMQAFVSLDRLNKFLTDAEIDTAAVERIEGGGTEDTVAVKVQGGVFAWDVPADEEMKGNNNRRPHHDVAENGQGNGAELVTVLRGIDVEVRRGEITAVVGTVGSGKSSLLSCIMGEMHKLSGTDLEMMEFGDQTEIGERGINLSGGQKQRIQLARAVYQDCDIYLLDDIFSAVDAHTGSAIFMECLKGILKNKTVLLVTHQVDFLQNVDTIIVSLMLEYDSMARPEVHV
ncbi:unnamed protein product [Miscanthus lutarioriparius]|uniref:Uncharacterized protein n=1 Tax=Miscanthus lutarioriparius TaxID=422564 RepID=A0A811R2W2_9POAL|nr:unnamed protein product [Miscanthus lutarioriparius]